QHGLGRGRARRRRDDRAVALRSARPAVVATVRAVRYLAAATRPRRPMMRVTRVTRVARLVAATGFSMMRVAGWASMRHPQPKALIARPGILTHGETLQYLGVDFSRTSFFDPYFQYSDVAKGKVPSWSQRALEDISLKFPMPISVDLSISEKHNAK